MYSFKYAFRKESYKKYKIAIVRKFRGSGLSQKKFAAKVGVPKGTFKKWINKVRILDECNIDTFYEGKGRPSKFDDLAKASIVKKISVAKRRQKSIRKWQKEDIYKEEVIATLARRNKAISDPTINRQTIINYENELGIGKKNGQLKPTARVNAENEPRNALSMFTMASAFCEDKSPKMILNFDATQFVTCKEGDKEMLFIKSLTPNAE
jgi:transposase